MNKKYKDLFFNTFIFGISSIASKLVVFICLPLYTLYLTSGEYGTVDLSQTIINLAIPVLSVCISDAVLRFGILSRYDRQSVFSNGLLLLFISILLFSSISIPISSFISLEKSRFYWLILLYTSLAFNNLFVSVLKVNNLNRIIAFGAILSSVIVIGFTYYGLVLKSKGIDAYYFGLVAGNLASVLFFYTIIKFNGIRLFSRPDKSILKEMLAYSLPLVPNTIFWWANNGLDKICLKIIIGISVTGIYASSAKIPSILNLIVTVFQQALNISAIQVFQDKVRKFWNKLALFYNLLLVTVGSWLIAFLPFIVRVLIKSDDFKTGVIVIPVLLVSVFFCAKSSFLGSIFTGSGHSSILFVSTAIGTLINLVLNIVLINKYSLLGAAFATCISNMVVCFIRYYFGRNEIQESISTIFSSLDLLLMIQALFYSTFSINSFSFHLLFSSVITVLVIVKIISLYNNRLATR